MKTKKKSYRKPRLNKKQKDWVNKFIACRPHARITDIYEGLSGDRVVTIEWSEESPLSILSANSYVRGQIFHQVRVKLRKFGDPRSSADYSYRIIAPQKHTTTYQIQGQLSLEIPQIYSVQTPINPVIVNKHRKNSSKNTVKTSQCSLPLSGITAQLHRINLSKTGEVLSERELLSETVLYHDSATGSSIHLPAAVVAILQDKQASPKEWSDAIALYQVGGPTCVMQYLEGLDALRHRFVTQPTTERNTIEQQGSGAIKFTDRNN
ncbi:MAG: hypothetical protein CLLPBCKN_007539 [Chroococcidiopsis cubana SAG 39.79]|uniref:Uncharacterized protein n=1 Tax=Chroococcidiopsis cubana SAG 39.79 TaxID=388085 RepID=A0AB37UV36_9CYAN|nr:hypothetical protein [Chroococcidiopsis cubana]MDZ4878104.1 hypothetical protein [Chroococcidiopsis cubana SAG 39.79]PSB65432.1 hypothetical protein C7B79_05420 [Chroococcidiopsis cubana CCALA 043]RUT14622.1 hypothetical protein DSM107010_01680 [Chroococcidiopsis cubana SAG 39.79]